MLVTPVAAQDTPVVTVDFRELRFSPESTSNLSTNFEAFRTDSTLVDLLEDNDTLFWEYIEGFDSNYLEDTSLASYAIVSINSTGFYQTIVALDPSSGDLEWVRSLRSSYSENYTMAVRTATDFFADDGHYWGLCEEIILLPGSSVGQSADAVWRFKFYLVGETERWTLLISTAGTLLTFSFEDVPCQSCIDYTPFVIFGFASAIVIVVVVAYYMKMRKH
jgi:hypothetical protein